MKLWKMVIWALVPISMFVWLNIAKAYKPFEPPPERETPIYRYKIPRHITNKYILKKEREDCLVPAKMIIYEGYGLQPWITIKERDLIAKERAKGKEGKMPQVRITFEVLFCICPNHAPGGDRLIIIRATDKDNVMRIIYQNPNYRCEDEEQEEPPPLPRSMA